MSRLSWRTSLSFRLSLVLGAAIALFGLMSTGVALFFDFRDTRETLLSQFEAEATGHAEQQSEELRGIQHDAQALFSSWRQLPDAIQDRRQYLVARYITTETDRGDSPASVGRALAFVEAYGGEGLGNFINTFVLLNGGYAVSKADGNFECYHQGLDLENLAKLRYLPVKDDLIWGAPYRTADGEWHLAVGRKDPTSGAVIGVTVRLSSGFVEKHLDVAAKQTSFWLDVDGQSLTQRPVELPANLSRVFRTCDPSHPQRIEGMQIICTELKPTRWRMFHAYPAALPTEQALTRLPIRLLVAVLMLVLLMGVLYVVLQRSLGRTLADFVQIIRPQAAVSDQQCLPEARADELGQIAEAYNRLVEAVRTQYAVLEAKVAERTVELEQARSRAERASANKSDQLTCISHEIRTPLNGIVGALMLLSRTRCDTGQHDLVDTALKCANHLLEIINDLLDFSRLESGQMVVTQSVLDPLILIDQAMLTVQLPAQDKRLALRTDIAASFPASLQTDGLRLRQVLINLLGNAVKFTTEGTVTLRAWSADRKVYFSVHDSGPGIPTDWMGEVFAAFKQVDSHVAGSGLGLPIARSLAQLLGGDLYITPVDLGTCFQLELPSIEESYPAATSNRGVISAPIRLHRQLQAWGYQPVDGDNRALEAPELAYLPAKLRQRLMPDAMPNENRTEDVVPVSAWTLQVLVVDDVFTNRDIVGRMLRLQGHQTWEAENGETALALGRSHVFDLVLMDMRMPGLSGTQTVSIWRDAANGMLDPECPIIALTANAQPGERARLLGGGFSEYLTKPVTPIMLAHAMEFAADLQLLRGVELATNAHCKQPVLAEAIELLPRLGTELRHCCRRLGEAFSVRDVEGCLCLLHTLKGLAGQAGLGRLHEAAKCWEEQLRHNGGLKPDTWEALGRLIEAELGKL
ncbi:two-component system sensor protein [Burkholderia lata]|uniref:two component system sensor kinase n=1 Tax=Burkholderia lata (strain ATCC 17760 / DSM 23089 / LMG 22485 / NCIMB 9086 / R18194 / 383) TaxID=482957 RepID=UPI001454B2BB|nr:two component system sensor kinase [Burkholderia lata]VWD65018.1 two-component system sensor protein [Burkholderia lata]